MVNIFGSVPRRSGTGTTKNWINLQQRMTEREIQGGKPGKLYRKNSEGVYVAQDSVTGFVAFVTQKRSYTEDRDSRCWSPDAERGRGKAGVHGVDPTVRECRGCPFREKEEGQSSPCAISWDVTIVEEGTGDLLTLELRRTSYPCGTKLMELLKEEENPETLAVTFSGKKVKAYYVFDVNKAESASDAPSDMAEVATRLRSEWEEKLFELPPAAESSEGTPVEESGDTSLEGDVPF